MLRLGPAWTCREKDGYERATGGHGGLSLRRLFRIDGTKTREDGPQRRRIRASHLRVRGVQSHGNLWRARGKRLMGRRPGLDGAPQN
jgi:hypothetical protein